MIFQLADEQQVHGFRQLDDGPLVHSQRQGWFAIDQLMAIQLLVRSTCS